MGLIISNGKKFNTSNEVIKPEFISINDILDSVSQEDLFFRFFGYTVKYNKFFYALHRKDTRPTATFRWFGNKLRLCDWGTGDFLDVFELIQRKHNCTFGQVMKIIKEDFNITIKNPEIFKNKPTIQETKIDVDYEYKWDKAHIAYWKDNYFFDGEHCKKHNIYQVKNAWINGIHIYGNTGYELAFCYKYLDGSKKLYFPNRTKKDKSPRFMGNSSILIGYDKLPDDGEIVIITKSHKEVACYDLFGIPAVSEQSEGVIVDAETIKELEKRFTYVIVNLDYDARGVQAMKKYKKLYGLPCFFLPIGKEAKDFSGYLKLNGVQDTLDMLEYYKDKL